MYNFYSFFKFPIIFLILSFVSGKNPKSDVQEIPGELILDLYSQYKHAVEADDTVSLRRFQKKNREFKIHVKKLKNVNGFKVHNLLLEEVKSAMNPIIYINNPVESKLPKTYLTLEEFKKALSDRVKHQRKEFKIQKTFKLKTMNKTVTITKDDFTTTTKLYTKIISKMKTFIVNKNITETENKLIKTTSKNSIENNITTQGLATPLLRHPTADITQTINDNITSQSTTISPNISTIIDPPSTTNDIVSHNDIVATSNLDLRITDSINEDILDTTIDNSDNFTLQSTTITPNSDISTTIDLISIIDDIIPYNDTAKASNVDVTDSDSKTEDFSAKTSGSNQESLRGVSIETSPVVTIPTSTSTKSKKSTLGRPLVFMGGYS